MHLRSEVGKCLYSSVSLVMVGDNSLVKETSSDFKRQLNFFLMEGIIAIILVFPLS